MSDQPNLFRDNAYRAVGPLVVETVERKVIDRYVTVAGVRLGLDDLYETLCEIEDSCNTYVTNQDYKVLVSIGVLTSLGGREYAASEGENFKDFLERVRAAYYDRDK